MILPAALPSFTAGLKQGWAFSWRSLMAGELLVIIAKSKSLGFLLASNRELVDAPGLMATMIVILVIGIIVDALFFAQIEKRLRHRWGPRPVVARPTPPRGQPPLPQLRSQWGRRASGSLSSSGTSSGRWSSAMSATVTSLQHGAEVGPHGQPHVAQR